MVAPVQVWASARHLTARPLAGFGQADIHWRPAARLGANSPALISGRKMVG